MSLTRQIKKRAERFYKALDSVEKQFSKIDNNTGTFNKFNLSEVILKDLSLKKEAKRKARNKHKSENKR